RRETIKNNPEILKKVINLGLDLQGGMRLVLEVDRSKLTKDEQRDVLDRAYTVIENRINALGVAEPSIQMQGRDRLIIELPGLKDEKAAKQVVGSTAQLEFKLLREPSELDKAIRTIDKVLKGDASSTIDEKKGEDTSQVEDKTVQEQAENLFSGKDIKQSDTSTITDTAKKDIEQDIFKTSSFSEYLVAVGEQVGVIEKNKGKVDEILSRKDVYEALKLSGLGGSVFLWGHDSEKRENIEYRPLYYVKKKAELKGDIIKDARWEIARGGMEAGQAVVNLEMNRDGARRFSRVTAVNVHKFLAIVLDSTVYSAPQIRQKISQGQAQITGSFTNDEAKALAVVLRAGALPAPVTIEEERTVGPSLGQDSIIKGVKAFIVGFILIVIFMIVYYRLSGIIADLALFLNLIFVLSIMASIGATLTLPGIAGLILTIGMAIDANVIIFERIREELSIGKTIRSAVDAGYSRAFVTIMDANITTLFTAAILMWVGTGPIKGFAITMIFGIIVSLFTALFLTRVIFNIITSSKNLKSLSI
ncbi:MAG: protein translocase subunit SecD, partial [Chitinispirillia bacterium]